MPVVTQPGFAKLPFKKKIIHKYVPFTLNVLIIVHHSRMRIDTR